MSCHLHSGLLAANQAQRKSSFVLSLDPVDAAIAEGKKLRDQSRVADSIAAFQRALELAQQRHDVTGETKARLMLGAAEIRNFEFRAALDSLEKARQLADRQSNLMLGGAANGNIGTVYSLVGDWQSADAASEQSIALLKKIPNPDDLTKGLIAQALQSHADICFHLGKTQEGYADSKSALSLAESVGNQQLQAMIWDVRGAAFMREGDIAEADVALQNALALSAKLHNADGLAFAKEHLSELELKRHIPDWHKALRLLDDAFAAQSPLFKSTHQYYPIHIRGKILELSGNKVASLSEYLRAVNVAGQWREGALPGDTTSSQTVALLQEVYADYAHLAAEISLEQNNNALAAKALEVLAENRAASLREQLRLAYVANGRLPDQYFFRLSQLQAAQALVTLGKNEGEDQEKLTRIRQDISNLENQIGIKPEKILSINEINPRRNSLRDIQRTLGRDQVLLSISLGSPQSYLWAVTGDRVNLSRLPGASELQSKAAVFSAAIRAGRDSSGPSSDLSHALFSGLPADVWNRSEWLVVADGPLLNGVPFCAIQNSRGDSANQQLIEGRSLRFLASELLLLDKKSATLSGGFVGIGDPVYNSADSRLMHGRSPDAKTVSLNIALPRLVGSAREIRSAAAESHSVDPILLTGIAATRENLTAALARPTGIVHFAVHVVSPANQPQQAALALSLKGGLPELLTPEVVAALHAPGSLVVLSGCSSGQGKFMPGVGLVGLGRAWLLAGAAAVVVSSWPTPDDSGTFFSSFYSHFDRIKSGDTAQRAALALRQTQLDLLRGTGYQASSQFWGAFAVISKE